MRLSTLNGVDVHGSSLPLTFQRPSRSDAGSGKNMLKYRLPSVQEGSTLVCWKVCRGFWTSKDANVQELDCQDIAPDVFCSCDATWRYFYRMLDTLQLGVQTHFSCSTWDYKSVQELSINSNRNTIFVIPRSWMWALQVTSHWGVSRTWCQWHWAKSTLARGIGGTWPLGWLKWVRRNISDFHIPVKTIDM